MWLSYIHILSPIYGVLCNHAKISEVGHGRSGLQHAEGGAVHFH